MRLQQIVVGVALVSLLASAPDFAIAFPVVQSSQEGQPGQSAGSQPAASPGDEAPINTTSAPGSSQDRTTALPDAPSSAQSDQATPRSSEPNSGAAQQTTQTPTGTAAARSAAVKGGAASKPAGAAIAPAKQNRRRSLIIKLGLLAGAGVAIGSVVALSKGSPSTPPGTH
jgi:hypothetical protein